MKEAARTYLKLMGQCSQPGADLGYIERTTAGLIPQISTEDARTIVRFEAELETRTRRGAGCTTRAGIGLPSGPWGLP